MPIVKAAVLAHARAPVAVQDFSLEMPAPGEVLLRMEACGICHSDLYVAGLEKLSVAPLILGHEGIGRVESAGSGAEGWREGDRAGITFLGATCGACEWCRSGRERFCPKQTNFGYTRHGALAEYVVAPASTLVRVPDSLPAVEAAPMCCAGWTAYGALREAGVREGQSIALFGFGGLGHLALQMALLRRLHAAVVDTSEPKLEAAREAGAEIALPAENAGRTLQKEHGGVDAAIVFTPAAAAIPQAFRALKRNGTLVLVGIAAAQYELPLAETVVKGVTVRGSYLGTLGDLQDVFELALNGAIHAQVQTHALEETPSILEKMRRGEVLGRAVIAY